MKSTQNEWYKYFSIKIGIIIVLQYNSVYVLNKIYGLQSMDWIYEKDS